MNKAINVAELLQPLFDLYREQMRPASEGSLSLFRKRTAERNLPDAVVTQMTDFYSITNGVPCLDSLSIHSCEDMILFE